MVFFEDAGTHWLVVLPLFILHPYLTAALDVWPPAPAGNFSSK